MPRLCNIVLIFVVAGVLGEDFSSYRENNGTLMARITGGATVSSTEPNYKFLCTIYDVSAAAAAMTGNKQKFGPGVIVHRKWVIAHSDLHSGVTDANLGDLRVSTLTTDGYTQPGTAITSRVRERIVQSPDSNSLDYLNKIQLLKVCPSLPADRVFDVNMAPTSIVPDDPYDFLNFASGASPNTLTKSSKTIAEDCECDTYIPSGGTTTTYNTLITPKTFCGKQSATTAVEATDKVGTVAVITKPAGSYLYAGFLLANNNGGDLYLDISAYLAWITPKLVP